LLPGFGAVSPSCSRDGPIEAGAFGSVPLEAICSPSCSRDGPIEATTRAPSILARRSSPSCSRDGPIEAVVGHFSFFPIQSPLRRVHATAPLKQKFPLADRW